VTATAAAKVGDQVPLRVSVSATGVETSTIDHPLAITEPGPDLRARNFTQDSTPGGTFTYRPTFHNHGDRTAETLILQLSGGDFASIVDRFSNCHWSPEPAYVAAVCILRNVDLPAGATIAAATPLTIKVGTDVARGAFTYYSASVYSNNGGISGPWDAWPLGTGPQFRWERVGAQAQFDDVDYRDSQGYVRINTPPNPSDVVALGANGTGKVGDTVTLKVGMTNKGPAYIDGVGDSEGSDLDDPYNAGFRVTFPTGVEVTAVGTRPVDGEACLGLVDGKRDGSYNEPGRTAYQCITWALGVGASYTVEFTVRITGPVGTNGTVVATGGFSDPVPADNTAAVTVNGGGSGGGGGGLPITGTNVALVSGAGAAILAVGVGLFVTARRRRATFVAE
jgi:hypothetical protein